MEELIIETSHAEKTRLGMMKGATQNRVSVILYLDADAEGNKLVMKNMQGENMGTISYQFHDQHSDYSNCKICSINFFGTQNGRKESDYAKRLDFLGEYSSDSSHIAYDMMQKFIQDICIPKGVEKIYLDADGIGKKFFWKEKIGIYLIQHDLIQGQFSQGTEICFVLKT